MTIYEGQTQDTIAFKDQRHSLPFELRLNDFRVEYYDDSMLLVKSRDGKSWRFPVKIGKEYTLDGRYENALEAYEKIATEFSRSQEARDIDKYIGRAQGRLNK